jgi:hypothetical protein
MALDSAIHGRNDAVSAKMRIAALDAAMELPEIPGKPPGPAAQGFFVERPA